MEGFISNFCALDTVLILLLYKAVTLSNRKAALLSWLEDSDLLELVAVVNSVIREEKYLWVEQEFPYNLESQRQWFEKNKAAGERTLVARVDDELVGAARLLPLTGKRAHVAEMAIYIADRYRNCGLGTALINELVDVARKVGFEIVQLSSFSTNGRAIHVYTKCGFKTCGKFMRCVKFKDGSFADLILMELFLT
jgi:L-amino acid N-acyltransferase YncA